MFQKTEMMTSYLNNDEKMHCDYYGDFLEAKLWPINGKYSTDFILEW
jgi:hypothetical protein